MRVLVTRPAALAADLCKALGVIGAIAETLPVIDIQPTSAPARLQAAIEELATIEIAIFISQTAVRFAMPAIQSYWHPLPAISWIAIGAGTAASLHRYGITQVLFPNPPYESESLLRLPSLQKVSGKKITLFRGNGGRELLVQVLQERGAKVQTIETYQRCLPTLDIVKKLTSFRHQGLEMIVTTSAESLKNLVRLAGKELNWLQEIPIIVVGTRMYALAKQLGFKKPLVAEGADHASIIKVLTTFKDSIQ